jgi:hypothetical protein
MRRRLNCLCGYYSLGRPFGQPAFQKALKGNGNDFMIIIKRGRKMIKYERLASETLGRKKEIEKKLAEAKKELAEAKAGFLSKMPASFVIDLAAALAKLPEGEGKSENGCVFIEKEDDCCDDHITATFRVSFGSRSFAVARFVRDISNKMSADDAVSAIVESNGRSLYWAAQQIDACNSCLEALDLSEKAISLAMSALNLSEGKESSKALSGNASLSIRNVGGGLWRVVASGVGCNFDFSLLVPSEALLCVSGRLPCPKGPFPFIDGNPDLRFPLEEILSFYARPEREKGPVEEKEEAERRRSDSESFADSFAKASEGFRKLAEDVGFIESVSFLCSLAESFAPKKWAPSPLSTWKHPSDYEGFETDASSSIGLVPLVVTVARIGQSTRFSVDVCGTPLDVGDGTEKSVRDALVKERDSLAAESERERKNASEAK